MEDFRKKLQEVTTSLVQKIKNGEPLSKEEMKFLFLNSFITEEQNEQ